MTQSDREIVFSEYPQRAPEYTENILWHRVALAGFLGLALIVLLLWGAARLIGGSEPSFDPTGLPATAALPADKDAESGRAESTSNAATETQGEDGATKPNTNLFAAANATKNATGDEAGKTRTITVSERPLAKENATTRSTAPTTTAAKSVSTMPARTAASGSAPSTAVTTTESPAASAPVDRQQADQFRNQIAVERLDTQVTRAVLSQEMDGIEPRTELSSMSDLDNDEFIRLYFFTDIKGMAGDTLTYHWIREGKTAARVRIPVHSNRWRSHSSKNITAKMRGHWEVVVTDKAGKTLARSEFDLPAAGS